MYNDYLNFIEDTFTKCFSQKGYIEERPVEVTSRIDKTVDFVGSKISPLKHYVLNDNISNKGHFLIQDCFRTQGLKKLKTIDPSRFGTCFRCMGTLTRPDIEKTVFDTFDYLTNKDYLGIMPENLRIRINSEDKDLLMAVSQIDKNIIKETNTHNAHYRHKYGLDDENIFGRDFNIAVRRRNTDEFVNAGAIVLMEKGDKPLAIDMGIGNLTLAMCNFGKDNTIAASRMADIIVIDSIEKQRFADVLIALSLLQKEGVHNFSKHKKEHSKNFKYKMKKYNDAVTYWKNKLGICNEQILQYMKMYIDLEFKANNYKSEVTWEK